MAAATVGRSSSRTPFKHWILNAEIGRLCGIFASPAASWRVPAIANPFAVYDLCAGDGEKGDGFDNSPAIISRHLQWASERGVNVHATLIEQAPATFAELVRNVAPQTWLDIVHGDAREFAFPVFGERQAIFIHSDPNNVHQWPITTDLLGKLSETTTMLATLGCNVGGLKLLPLDKRLIWFEHVRACVDVMPRYHDAVLVALDGDSSQWAYLLRLPSKWSRDTCQNIATVGARFTSFGLSFASLRASRDEFNRMQERLFLRHSEQKAVAT